VVRGVDKSRVLRFDSGVSGGWYGVRNMWYGGAGEKYLKKIIIVYKLFPIFGIANCIEKRALTINKKINNK
jgi:hypothetical protein